MEVRRGLSALSGVRSVTLMSEGQEPRVAVLACPSRLASELQASFVPPSSLSVLVST